MTDKLEQAIAEYLKDIKVKSGGIANLPLFTDIECAAVSQGVAQAIRHLLATEPEALGLEQVGYEWPPDEAKLDDDVTFFAINRPYYGDKRDRPLYALPQEGEKP